MDTDRSHCGRVDNPNKAAYGQISGISENEAFTSLVLLLRLAQFIDKEWVKIT